MTEKLSDETIAALVDQHSDALLRFFRGSGIAYSDAADFVQTTFETLLRKNDGAILDPKLYLWGIARKKVLQYRERHKPVDEFRSSRVIPEAVTTASQRLDRRFRVMALLQHLDEQQRTAFLLRCEGLALEVIAETMKLSLATVKRKLKQARAQIEQVASEDTHAFGDEALTVDDVIDSYRRD